MADANNEIPKMPSFCEKLAAPLDRLQEAHWFIHQMEQYYHHAKEFRWCLNCFLRALKEVPQLLQMGFQNDVGFPEWFRNERACLSNNALATKLSNARNFVVHQGMLVPTSYGYLGITDGRKLKLGIGMAINPMRDSDDEMMHYIRVVASHGDVFELLKDDEETAPCVDRSWRLKGFPDRDVLDLTSEAWLLFAQLVNAVVEWFGEKRFDLSLNCRHQGRRVQIKIYDRGTLNEQLSRLVGERQPVAGKE